MPTGKRKTKRTDIDASLSRMRDVPSVPESLVEMAEQVAQEYSNSNPLAYAINAATVQYSVDVITYKRNPQKALDQLVVAISNACALYCPELEINPSHMYKELVYAKVIPSKESLFEVPPEALDTARKYTRLASVRRKNGGAKTWKVETVELLDIIARYGDEMPLVIACLRETKSLGGEFIGRMDGVATPLLRGAL